MKIVLLTGLYDKHRYFAPGTTLDVTDKVGKLYIGDGTARDAATTSSHAAPQSPTKGAEEPSTPSAPQETPSAPAESK